MTNTIRSFRISQVKLEQTAIKIESYAIRDKQELSEYGIAESEILRVGTLVNELKNLKTDNVYRIELSNLVIIKEMQSEELRTELRKIANKVNMALGSHSPEYQRLTANRLNKANPAVLIKISQETIDALSTQLTMLETYGITTERLNQLQLMSQNIQNAINSLTLLNAQRSTAAQERNTKILELVKIITRISKAGKFAWDNTDAVKHKEYVLGLYKCKKVKTQILTNTVFAA